MAGVRGGTSEHLIEARDLRFAYGGRGPAAVAGASLALARGRLSALIGANGSGKSTLIRLLGGLLSPAGGEITFDGAPLAGIERVSKWRAGRLVDRAADTGRPAERHVGEVGVVHVPREDDDRGGR